MFKEENENTQYYYTISKKITSEKLATSFPGIGNVMGKHMINISYLNESMGIIVGKNHYFCDSEEIAKEKVKELRKTTFKRLKKRP